jgi:hypothetical protein
MRWKLVDRTTGAENSAIDWHFSVDDQVKIRLVNEMDSDHPRGRQGEPVAPLAITLCVPASGAR